VADTAGEAVEILAGEDERTAQERLTGCVMLDAQDAEAAQKVRLIEQGANLQAPPQVLTRQKEGGSLASRHEARVCPPLPAAELGEVAIQVAVANHQQIQQLWLHVRHQRQQQHQPLIDAHRQVAHQLGVLTVARRERRRRNLRDARVLAGLAEVQAEPCPQHALEPRQLQRQRACIRSQRALRAGDHARHGTRYPLSASRHASPAASTEI
jgi:hypothetical protein